MITVTDSAKQLLKETLSTHTDDPSIVLRLSFIAPGQFGFLLDKEAKGDQVVEHEGLKLLLVEPNLASMVDGVTLGVKDTPKGPEFIVVKGG
jgi:Fe-S cluster assembly iron-binding protein IscA